jgi:hypothetical protein
MKKILFRIALAEALRKRAFAEVWLKPLNFKVLVPPAKAGGNSSIPPAKAKGSSFAAYIES